MKTRASRRAIVLVCGLTILLITWLVVGCKQVPSDSGTTTETPQDQNAALLQQIKQNSEEGGQNTKELLELMKHQQELQAQQAGDPPLVRDLAAARFYLSDAQKAADAKNADSTKAAIRPLKRVLTAMAAEMPGTLIAQHLDRAAYLIRNQQAIGSHELTVASPELSAASDVSSNGRPAAVVPDVLGDIKSAKAAVGKGDAAEALKALQSALSAIGKDPLADTLARSLASVHGAEDALGRTAWPVVSAEFSELDSILTDLSKTVAPQTVAPAKAPTAEQTPAAGQTPPAEQAPAAGPATSAVPNATAPAAPPTTPPAAQPTAPPATAPAS